MATKIAWTDSTWSPVTGCTKIAAGCKNCFADAMTRRFWKQWGCESPPNHFKVRLHPERLEQPLHWRKPRRIFVCSMSDLFHEQVPFAFVDRVFAAMINCKRHTYQLLTKRPQRALDYYVGRNWRHDLSHIHLGVSCSTQADVNKNIPLLMQIPAAVRFVSLEPYIAPVDLEKYLQPVECVLCDYDACPDRGDSECRMVGNVPSRKLDQVIVGCESMPGGRAGRHCDIEWVRSIVRQCKEAGTACFVKQIEINGKVSHDILDFPKEIQIREFPNE